jgi:hypothetical protein
LTEIRNEYFIPRFIRLHGELCNENSDRLADRIAECVDWILPLYFSPEAIRNAWRQLQIQKAVLIEGAVATKTGAEVVMSHLDEQHPSFMQDSESIPRGRTSVPFESPAIGDPSLNVRVLEILEDLARGARVPYGRATTGSPRKDVASRTQELKELLCGWLEWDKTLTCRTTYCALEMPESLADRVQLKKILKKVHELVPPLVFIELSPESHTRRQEMAFIKCLNTRFESNPRQRSNERSGGLT